MPWFNPFGFFAMFAIGALGAGLQTLLLRVRNFAFDIFLLVTLAAAFWIIWRNGLHGGGEFYGWLRVPYQFPAFHLLMALALASGPSSRVVGRLLDNPLVAWIARISFGIYVWHYLVLELVRLSWVPEMSQGGMADPAKFLIASAVITAITMVIASLSYRWLEAPVILWARRLEHAGARKASVPA
jgi:peptidoglycan/LPS O-acetylase OafA/YrhL